jgi:hypothetical protein
VLVRERKTEGKRKIVIPTSRVGNKRVSNRVVCFVNLTSTANTVQYYPSVTLERLRKTMKSSVGLADLWADIRLP